MLSFFKKKKIIPHIKLSGVIGNVGKFKQGIDFSGQEDIITKAFSLKNLFPIISNVLDGVCASSLNEAKLGKKYFSKI